MSAKFLSIALKDDDAVAASEVNHTDSNSNVFVKRAFIHNSLASVDCNNSLHQGSIVKDAWEDDATVQNSHKEPTRDDETSTISKRERLMREKLQKMITWRVMHNFLSAHPFMDYR